MSQTLLCCPSADTGHQGAYTCTSCGAINCHVHAAKWTNDIYRCYYCFGPLRSIQSPPELVIHRMRRSSGSQCKILLVIDGLYVAGAQRHCLELLQVLCNRGFACTVLAIEGGGRWASKFLSVAETVVVSSNESITWDVLTRSIENDNFTFVSAHLIGPVKWALKNVPFDISCYGHLHSEPSEHEEIDGALLEKVVKRCVKVFVPSSSTRERLMQEMERAGCGAPEECFQTLPNALPSGFSANQTISAAEHEEQRMRVAIISRLDDDKFSIPLFLSTISELVVNYPWVKVRVAGDGECADDTKLKVNALGLSRYIEFLGFVDDIGSIYEWSDVVFLPSKREAMPYVLLECIATARPLVAPAVGIFRDISQPGALFKFESGDSKQATEAIIVASHAKNDCWGSFKSYGVPEFASWSAIVQEKYDL